jgi:hypothetical protein
MSYRRSGKWYFIDLWDDFEQWVLFSGSFRFLGVGLVMLNLTLISYGLLLK